MPVQGDTSCTGVLIYMILLDHFLFPCNSQVFFGIPCPVCGFQRAFVLLTQGQLLASLKMFPALVPSLFLILFSVIRLLKPSMVPAKFLKIFAIIVLAIIVTSYVFTLASLL